MNFAHSKRNISSPAPGSGKTKRITLRDISNAQQDDRCSTAGKMDMSDEELEEDQIEEEVFQIDLDQASDPQSCAEFAPEIYRYLHQAQLRYQPGEYLKTQPDISQNMTGILMDWLVEVAEEYHLTNETLHLAKQYIDRFLGLQKVTRARLQLVGVSGMLIASKFEEIFPPGVDDFVYISDNTFTRNQVIEMETNMLNALQFDLTNPTALEFLMRYVRISNADTVCTSIAKYLIELTLMDYNMVAYLPSHIALSALMLASHARNVQPALHSSLQGFVAPEEHVKLTSCMNAVHKLWVGASRSKLQAVRLKYERTRNNKVSLIIAPNMPPLF